MPTILELFRGAGLDKQVKPDRVTKVEQEVTGIRIKSAVEINNPLIYGTDTFRIANRSTKMKDKMIELRNVGADGGTDATDGAIQKGLKKVGKSKFAKKVKGKFNKFKSSKVGTKLSKIVGKPPGDTNPSSILGELKSITDIQLGYPKALSDLKGDLGGSGLLKGGLPTGNPKTAAQQAAGKVLDEAKSKIRGALFGSPAGMGTNSADDSFPRTFYNPTDTGTYTKQTEDLVKESDSTDGDFGILKRYKGNEASLAEVRVGKGYIGKRGTAPDGTQDLIAPTDGINPAPKGTKSFPEDDNRFSKDNNQLISDRGFTNKDDVINQSGIHKDDLMVDGKSIDEFDFIPLKFRNIVTNETVNFRGTITGLSETVSPSWNSNRFSGNPFNFYTYDSVERGANFNFTVYPMNSNELVNNWSKIEFLTSLTYPLGYQGDDIGAVRAPIIYLTIGDLYKDKVCFIESLQYTIPDNSTWQLDGTMKDYESSKTYFGNTNVTTKDASKGYKLPHLVEVAVTVKFIEQRNNTGRTQLYSFDSITY